MRSLTVPTARNLTTGETRQIAVDPHVYTSVHQWKPVTPERFLALLHQYTTHDWSIDEFGNGEMSTKSMHLDHQTTATIHYQPKSTGDCVSMPVLMTMEYGGSKARFLAFASTQNGFEAAVDG